MNLHRFGFSEFKVYAIRSLLLLLASASSGCGNNETCSVGSEGCDCTKGGGCDKGLNCYSGKCVKDDEDPTDYETDAGKSIGDDSGIGDDREIGDEDGGITLETLDDSSIDHVTDGPIELTGLVELEDVRTLFSKYAQSPSLELAKVTAFDLEGNQVVSTGDVDDSSRYSIELTTGNAYLINVETTEGVKLWSLTPILGEVSSLDIDLQSTYAVSLIYASTDTSVTESEVQSMLDRADEALNKEDPDRLVVTVKTIINHGILKKIDYSPVTETNETNLRAFAGGLSPVRDLESIIDEPELQYFPFIYARRIVSPLLPSNILMSEINAERWDYRVHGKAGYDGGPHVTNGGSLLVFDSNRHYHSDVEDSGYNTLSIYTIELSADAQTEAVRLTPYTYNSQDPCFSWDEEKIAFTSNKNGSYEIYVMDKDGSNMTQLTTYDDASIHNLVPRWSPDNKKIIYEHCDGDCAINIIDADGTENQTLLDWPESFEGKASFSPDGRQIIFYSDKTGGSEIYLMNSDGSDVKMLTDNEYFDGDPYWAHNGIDIVYSTREKYDGEKKTLRGMNVISNEQIFDLGDFAMATEYYGPVWAATAHLLLPNRESMSLGCYDENGYVCETKLDELVEDTPEANTAYAPTSTISWKPGKEWSNEMARLTNYVPPIMSF